jgi:hypothetical protein
MKYRRLGKTGLQVSDIGIGGGGLRCSTDDYAIKMIHRALELGLNYIDTAVVYGDSEAKVGMALEGRRSDAYVATKIDAINAEEGEKEFAGSLQRLRTDYVDILHLHGIEDSADLAKRTAPGGAYDVLRRAKQDGRARFIGVTGHRHDVMTEAVKTGLFEVVLFIMNIVEQDATKELIPECLKRNIGMTVMKPLATGMVPSRLALRYLLSQPIAVACPSASRLEWLEDYISVSELPMPLTAGEQADIARLHQELYHTRCRICGLCDPCPQDIRMGYILGTFRFFNEYRSAGREATLSFPWGAWSKERFPLELANHMAAIERCNDCGECEPRCPFGLPIRQLLRDMLPPMRELQAITRVW